MSYLDLDFKSSHAPTQKTISRRRKLRPSRKLHINRIIRGFTALITLIGAVYLTLSFLPDSVARVEDSNLKPQRLHYSVLLPVIEETRDDHSILPENVKKQADSPWKSLKIKTGDTLASLFSSVGLDAGTTHKVANHNEQTKKLRNIRPGQTIAILINDENQLVGLKYMPDITHTLVVKRLQDDSLNSELLYHPLDPIPVFRSGKITSSLFETAAEKDIPENIIMELAGIFGWDIDFALDIRRGDEFGIVYNELYKDGVKIRNGRILAAEFINQGKKFQAVYYTDPKGDSDYYSPDGKSMRKAFLRSPVKFSRISSRFSRKRWHPILSKWRSHNGVDYAAARGTPIRAAGDGKVKLKGVKGGYGKTIILQHGQKYQTVYAHMSRYARGIRSGKRIKQGQIIGYVGSSGLASGAHLHYEFRVNGVHRNPLKVKLPAAEPVDKAYKNHFDSETEIYLTMLKLMRNENIAQLNYD